LTLPSLLSTNPSSSHPTELPATISSLTPAHCTTFDKASYLARVAEHDQRKMRYDVSLPQVAVVAVVPVAINCSLPRPTKHDMRRHDMGGDEKGEILDNWNVHTFSGAIQFSHLSIVGRRQTSSLLDNHHDDCSNIMYLLLGLHLGPVAVLVLG